MRPEDAAVTQGESNDHTPVEPTTVVARLPRFGAAASGGLSLLLASSVLVLFPLGLLIAPLGLVPVVQQVAAGRRSIAAWGWVVLVLALLAVQGVDLLGLPVATYLVVYVLVIVVPTVSIELWQATGWTEGRWVAATTLAGSVLSMAAVVAMAWPTPPLEALAAWWRQAAAVAEESYRAVGVSSGQLELALDTVESVIPWIFVSVPVAYLVVLIYWIRPRLAVLGFPLPIVPFERFRAEEWLPACFAIAGTGTLLLDGTPRWVAVNLLIAVLMLYFVQGLAIIRAHLARWVGRGWLVRWGVALLCLQGPLPLVVAALGIADGFYSLRPRVSDNGGDT
jgi:hypothetical protein